jgi:hypothetical protein
VLETGDDPVRLVEEIEITTTSPRRVIASARRFNGRENSEECPGDSRSSETSSDRRWPVRVLGDRCATIS